MDLIQLFWTIALNAPLVNYTGYDRTGTNVVRTVSLVLCQNLRFESRIKTNGVYQLQIAYSTNGAWETFGAPITAPTTNIQTWPVPNGERYFRLTRK